MIDKVKRLMGKSYTIVAITSVLMVLLLINFYHITSDNIVRNVFFILISIGIIFLINKFVIDKLKDKNIKKCIIVLLIIFALFEILSVIYFRVEYNWDFKWLMDSSKDLATKGVTDNVYYFKIFPNNWGALLITTFAMKLTFGTEIGAYAINIIFIFLAALFSVLSAKKIGGNKLALNVCILLIGCAPLYLYSPIVYTDTLSLLFPVATLYLWLLVKENRTTNIKKSYILTFAMAIVGAIGYCIKPVAAIILVAIIIDEFFTNLNKETIKKIALIGVTVIIIMKSFNFICEKYIIDDKRGNDLEFPMTHWIMMGLNKPESEGGTSIGYGAYSQKDADYTAESGNFEKKKEANILKIKERLHEYGKLGYLQFLFNKFKYVWNDGSYYAVNLIGWDTLNKTSTPYKLIVDEKSNGLFRNYMTDFNNYMFFIIMAGTIVEVIKKKNSQEMRIMGISIVGIALFLLLWEARSRYIYFLIPVFCIYSAYEFNNVIEIIGKVVQKKKKTNNKDVKLIESKE